METVLSARGYAIPKAGNEILVESLREALTARPKVNPMGIGAGGAGGAADDGVKAFAVYRESASKFYMPRHFGEKRFGKATVVRAGMRYGDGEALSAGVTFAGELRPEQRAPAQAFLKAAAERGGGMLVLPCAYGKCLARNTPVLRADGSIVPVQDVQTGDRLVGDDGKPRRVLSICCGREPLYRVAPADASADGAGAAYVVNESHILTLKRPNGEVADIPLRKLLALPDAQRETYFGYKVGVAWPARPLPDGADPPYVYGRNWAIGRAVVASRGDGRDDGGRMLAAYRVNEPEVQRATLYGVLDAIGARSVGADGYDEIRFALPEEALKDVLFLARSLAIPARRVGSRAVVVRPGAPNAPTAITVTALGPGEYFGFAIDGNRRFLLGDFTVTHNTALSLYLSCQIGKKTLIVCHKEFLMNQWRERIAQFAPTASVGLVKQGKVDVAGRDYVLASLQSLAMRDYDADALAGFGLVCWDECHHNAAEVFSRALSKVNAPVMLGLSATPNRKDGLRKVIEWFLGKPAYSVLRRGEAGLSVVVRRYFDGSDNAAAGEYARLRMLWNGKPNTAAMITAVCAHAPRNAAILAALGDILAAEPDRKVIVLSDRRAHLTALKKLIDDAGLGTTGFYVGGMKQALLDASAERQIILATGAMANEGLDIPALNTLVFASPVTAIEQPIGRIQRQKPDERTYAPLVLDFWDDFSVFYNQGTRRQAFYKKNGYEVTVLDREGAPEPAADRSDAGSASTSASASDADSPKPRRKKPAAAPAAEKRKAAVRMLPDEDAEELAALADT